MDVDLAAEMVGVEMEVKVEFEMEYKRRFL